MKSVSWRAANLATAAVLVLAFVATQPLLASSPFGIYAIIDKVVFEPGESAPERSRSGACLWFLSRCRPCSMEPPSVASCITGRLQEGRRPQGRSGPI